MGGGRSLQLQLCSAGRFLVQELGDLGFNQPFLAVCPRARNFTSLGLHFPTGKLDYPCLARTVFRGSLRLECSLSKAFKESCDQAGTRPLLRVAIRGNQGNGTLEARRVALPMRSAPAASLKLWSPPVTGRKWGGARDWASQGPLTQPFLPSNAQRKLPSRGQGTPGRQRVPLTLGRGCSFEQTSQEAQARHLPLCFQPLLGPHPSHFLATHQGVGGDEGYWVAWASCWQGAHFWACAASLEGITQSQKPTDGAEKSLPLCDLNLVFHSQTSLPAVHYELVFFIKPVIILQLA